METAARLARIGNRIITAIATILMLLIFMYSSYSLWDTWCTYRGAFTSGELLQYKPDPVTEDTATLEELAALNPDVRGWITIDDTHIDYPLVQGKDDAEYLNKDVNGEFALSGAIFLTAENASDLTDRYNLIYGHHMDNGGMFGDVIEFLNADYFERHKAGKLYLPDRVYQIEIFACVEADAYDGGIYHVSAENMHETNRELLDHITSLKGNFRELSIGDTDQIVALSTCMDAATNGRAVLFGKLVPEEKTTGK